MPVLLRLRHWQAFLLLFVLPFLLQYSLLQLLRAASVDPGWLSSLLLNALPSVVYVLWLWRVGLFLFWRLPAADNSSRVYFHMGAVYFFLYTLLFIYTLTLVKESVLNGNFPYGMLLLLAPMHLLATFCFLYMVYFAAKALVRAEQQRDVRFGEFSGAYFLFMFLPLGIWFLQPRLHKFTTGTGRA
ncbi:hypothetical protein GCM10023188_47260 [Pontibacter saemangeumensis]|uniref:Transmembrane protein n=1 Tax=Pontibacter saemangeumensis TaxID=1084525 RepID=A0ABP8M7K4_9BACT